MVRKNKSQDKPANALSQFLDYARAAPPDEQKRLWIALCREPVFSGLAQLLQVAGYVRSYQEITAFTAPQIDYWMKMHPRRRPAWVDAAIIALWDAGHTRGQIALELDLPLYEVKSVIDRKGKRRGRKRRG
jgi:hypothetical protein